MPWPVAALTIDNMTRANGVNCCCRRYAATKLTIGFPKVAFHNMRLADVDIGTVSAVLWKRPARQGVGKGLGAVNEDRSSYHHSCGLPRAFIPSAMLGYHSCCRSICNFVTKGSCCEVESRSQRLSHRSHV